MYTASSDFPPSLSEQNGAQLVYYGSIYWFIASGLRVPDSLPLEIYMFLLGSQDEALFPLNLEESLKLAFPNALDYQLRFRAFREHNTHTFI